LEGTLREACERGDFRVTQYSIQGNHLHLLVEAERSAALGRGMKAIAARVARAINRTVGRTGRCCATATTCGCCGPRAKCGGPWRTFS
jgi:REP element-mobilizing transposase RayT